MFGSNLKVEGCALWIMDEGTRYLQFYTFPLTALFIFFFLHLIFCCFKPWKLLSSFSGDKRTAVERLTYLSSFSLNSTVHWGKSSKLGFSPTVPWSRLQRESYWLVLYYVCELWPTLKRGTLLQIWDMPVSIWFFFFKFWCTNYLPIFELAHTFRRQEIYPYWLKFPNDINPLFLEMDI